MSAFFKISSPSAGICQGRLAPKPNTPEKTSTYITSVTSLPGAERRGIQPHALPALCASSSVHPRSVITMAAATERAAPSANASSSKTLLCTSLTASTVSGMLAEADEAVAAGADIVELRLDYLESFNPEADLPTLLKSCPLPSVVTYRPKWEGGRYTGDDAPRLAALHLAATLGAAYIDVELKAADTFFSQHAPAQVRAAGTQVILSSHDYSGTASEADLLALVDSCRSAGADIVKFATTANDVTEAARVLRVLRASVPAGPVIALAMGERGQITRILAPKYGGFLTFGALSPERQSAPGQPTVHELRERYHIQAQNSSTKVYGIVGNPVSHSRSPAIHNAALEDVGYDGVYVPLLVDDMSAFLLQLPDTDWAGLSVTIPHKGCALRCAQSADPVAAQIGAANTLVRQPDGSLKAYNTDWSAAISAIERGLGGTGASSDAAQSPLKGKNVVVLGAGGAGRALAFGAAARGANVVIANRSLERAKELAADLSPGARGVSLDSVVSGAIKGDVLVNTTSVGMHPHEDATPVPSAALSSYALVFDAVYTPRHTRLLREAAAAGCIVVTGDEMFVGQAADQFKLFTGKAAPVELMRKVVLDSLGEK